MDDLTVIDLRAAPHGVALEIGNACRAHGFLCLMNHGIDEGGET